MTENNQEQQVDIPDEDLPDDLVPGEDNPLAEGLPDGETVEGLLEPGEDRIPDDPEDNVEDVDPEQSVDDVDPEATAGS